MSPSQLRAHFERIANPPSPPKSKWVLKPNSAPEGAYKRTQFNLGPPPKKSLADLP